MLSRNEKKELRETARLTALTLAALNDDWDKEKSQELANVIENNLSQEEKEYYVTCLAKQAIKMRIIGTLLTK